MSNDALRYDAEKLRFDLLPPEAMIELARIYTIGAIKYEDNNWRKGMNYSKCFGALYRHLLKFQSGQTVDPETGCHHMAQVAWNAIALMVYDLHGSGNDDRIKLDINDAFEWITGNGAKLGLSPEALAEFKAKYGKK